LAASILRVLARIAATTFVLASPSNAWARHSSAPRVCDPETGDAVRPDVQALNRLKNRATAPNQSQIDRSASLEAMTTPGDDRRRWDTNRGAPIEGYVADVKMGGIESTNCRARSAHDRDTHIDLTLTAKDAGDETKHVIVEVTPRWRATMAAKGVDWETDTLRQTILGRCVRVTGWLLFDAEHARESANTAAAGREVWRATAWEVHPVTSLIVLARCH
jgi:hypothetical protein